jgi:hypothetical protein
MGIAMYGELAVLGLATSTATGLFTYNTISGETSESAVVTTEGFPNFIIYTGD